MSVSSRPRAVTHGRIPLLKSSRSASSDAASPPQPADGQLVCEGPLELLPGHNKVLLAAGSTGLLFPGHLQVAVKMTSKDADDARLVMVQNSVERFMDDSWRSNERVRPLMPSVELCSASGTPFGELDRSLTQQSCPL